jgi:BirA family biotin operon repressor/biotin-[acetyl-CoA-carboxylase] ligase
MTRTAENTLLNDYHLLSYDVLDSTNAEAQRLAGGGASHGAVIWAKRQSAGRGLLGREWVSSEGNLFVTVLINPTVALEKCPQLSFVAALAVAETLEGILPEPSQVSCKWPNDVLVSGKKIAGVLLEAFTTKEAHGNKQWIAVGVGINVDNFPEHVMFPATCLREAGVELISAKIVLSRFVHHFIHGYDRWLEKGFAPIEKSWKSRAHQLGKAVEVIVGDAQVKGVFEGIDANGAMLLRDKKKNLTAINAGDVFYKEPA